MSTLSDKQKQLLFDYSIGLTNEKENTEVEQLLSSHEDAVKIHSKLKPVLELLDNLETESCSDTLFEQTIMRLNKAATESQARLEELLANEESQTVNVKSPFLGPMSKVLAAAAAILFFAGVFITLTNFVRQNSWQHRCQSQLHNIFNALRTYASDHNNRYPSVLTASGQPWWKVGYQGKENYSNTRHIWLLVKGDYLDYDEFICPGNKQSGSITIKDSQIEKYNDFPTRRYITYSLRIKCLKPEESNISEQRVLIADLNPLFEKLFEKLPEDYSRELNLEPDKKLLKLNSINHNRRGQNVLFSDGSVKFIKVRHANISEDDIFTLRDTEIYHGVEVPSSNADVFLAP